MRLCRSANGKLAGQSDQPDGEVVTFVCGKNERTFKETRPSPCLRPELPTGHSRERRRVPDKLKELVILEAE